MAISLPERCYCADVDFPMAIVGTAGRRLIVYSLENKPTEFKQNESPLKFQHRAVAIFRDKKKTPTGYALGSIEGRVAIQYVSDEMAVASCHRFSKRKQCVYYQTVRKYAETNIFSY